MCICLESIVNMMLQRRLRFFALGAFFLFYMNIKEVPGQQIPVQVWREILQMNRTEFISQLIRGNASGEDDVANELWPTDQASDPEPVAVGVVAAMLAPPAEACQPKLMAVQLPKDLDPNVVKYPECTPLDRCGGCCGHDMLECRPFEISEVTRKVVKSRYDHALREFVYMGIYDEVLEEHVTCGCQCKVRAEHCNLLLQEYLEESCRCRCYNEHMASTCPSNRRWDEQQCDCVCPQVYRCDSNEIFSHQTCSCELDLGTPVREESDDVGSVNQCLDTTCRAGYQVVPQDDGACYCVQSDHWGVDAANAQPHEYDPSQVPASGPMDREQTSTEEPTSTTTVTTAPTTTRRPRRPRPTSRRVAVRRPRPRGR